MNIEKEERMKKKNKSYKPSSYDKLRGLSISFILALPILLGIFVNNIYVKIVSVIFLILFWVGVAAFSCEIEKENK